MRKAKPHRFGLHWFAEKKLTPLVRKPQRRLFGDESEDGGNQSSDQPSPRCRIAGRILLALSCDHRASRSQGREDGKPQWKAQVSAIETPLRKAPHRPGQLPSVWRRIDHIQEPLKSADAASVVVADVEQIGLHIVEASPHSTAIRDTSDP